MNKFSMYVASAGLAALIGCQDQPAQPSQGSYEQTLQSCLEKLGDHTTGYTGNFTSDFTANVMRPHGANIDVSNEAYACTVYKNGFESIENPDGKAITVGEGPVVMLGEDDITSTYRDLVLGEADTMGIASSYLGDADWAREFVEAPLDAQVCQTGKEYWRADSADPVNVKVRTKYVTIDRLPGMISARLNGKYGIEDATNEQTVADMATLLGYDLEARGYVVAAKDCPEDSQ